VATYDEDDYMLLSGIQHFAFCNRQWALIYIENVWNENLLTMGGKIMHERAHNTMLTEKRGDLIITRDMPVISHCLRVQGKCDVVEFRRDDDRGVSLFGRKGKWRPCPVEYKRGSPKTTDADRLQLCAQAVCLEEMLLCLPIDEAFIYYGETKRRETVALSSDLRGKMEVMFAEMHRVYAQGKTTRVKASKSCNSCSLQDVCLPKLPQSKSSVRDYMDRQLISL